MIRKYSRLHIAENDFIFELSDLLYQASCDIMDEGFEMFPDKMAGLKDDPERLENALRCNFEINMFNDSTGKHFDSVQGMAGEILNIISENIYSLIGDRVRNEYLSDRLGYVSYRKHSAGIFFETQLSGILRIYLSDSLEYDMGLQEAFDEVLDEEGSEVFLKGIIGKIFDLIRANLQSIF